MNGKLLSLGLIVLSTLTSYVHGVEPIRSFNSGNTLAIAIRNPTTGTLAACIYALSNRRWNKVLLEGQCDTPANRHAVTLEIDCSSRIYTYTVVDYSARLRNPRGMPGFIAKWACTASL